MLAPIHAFLGGTQVRQRLLHTRDAVNFFDEHEKAI